MEWKRLREKTPPTEGNYLVLCDPNVCILAEWDELRECFNPFSNQAWSETALYWYLQRPIAWLEIPRFKMNKEDMEEHNLGLFIEKHNNHKKKRSTK